MFKVITAILILICIFFVIITNRQTVIIERLCDDLDKVLIETDYNQLVNKNVEKKLVVINR